MMTHLCFKELEVLLVLFLLADKTTCGSFYPVSTRPACSNMLQTSQLVTFAILISYGG